MSFEFRVSKLDHKYNWPVLATRLCTLSALPEDSSISHITSCTAQPPSYYIVSSSTQGNQLILNAQKPNNPRENKKKKREDRVRQMNSPHKCNCVPTGKKVNKRDRQALGKNIAKESPFPNTAATIVSDHTYKNLMTSVMPPRGHPTACSWWG